MELIDGMQGKVGELPCKLEDLEQLQTKYCVGNVYQRREGLRVRIVGDELPEEALPVKDSIDLEDVYMYHVHEFIKQHITRKSCMFLKYLIFTQNLPAFIMNLSHKYSRNEPAAWKKNEEEFVMKSEKIMCVIADNSNGYIGFYRVW